jgi:hypothetical protein
VRTTHTAACVPHTIAVLPNWHPRVSTDAAARVSATANAAVPVGTYPLSYGRAGALSSNAGVSYATARMSATANTAMPVGTRALCNPAGGLPPNSGLPHAAAPVSNAHGGTTVPDANLSVGAHTLSIIADLS